MSRNIKLLFAYALYIGVLAAAAVTLHTHIEASYPGNNQWGDYNVGVILDSTADMENRMATVAAAYQASNLADVDDTTFHLSAYKDTHQYLGNTTNPAQFAALINNLEPSGGDDCIDNPLPAVNGLLREMPRGTDPLSNIVLVAGSTPKGDRTTYALLLDRLNRHGTTLDIVLLDWCDDEDEPIELSFLALASGGRYFAAQDDDARNDLEITFNRVEANDLIIQASGTSSIDIAVPDLDVALETGMPSLSVEEDDYYNCLTCIRRVPNIHAPLPLVPNNLSVEIVDPNGDTVGAPASGWSILQSFSRLFRQANNPVDGTWQLRISGDSQYNVRMATNSELHLAYQGPYSAQTGQQVFMRALIDHESLLPKDIISPTFSLVSMDGQTQTPLDLFDDGNHRDGQAGDGVFGGRVTVLQEGCQFIMVNGTLPDGSHFQRQFPVPIRFRNYRNPSPQAGVALPDSTQTMSFQLTNGSGAGRFGASATTFDLNIFSEQGWTVESDIPASVTLDPGQSVTYHARVTIPADAALGTVEEVSFIAAPVGDIALSSVAVAETTIVDQLPTYIPTVNRAPD